MEDLLSNKQRKHSKMILIAGMFVTIIRVHAMLNQCLNIYNTDLSKYLEFWNNMIISYIAFALTVIVFYTLYLYWEDNKPIKQFRLIFLYNTFVLGIQPFLQSLKDFFRNMNQQTSLVTILGFVFTAIFIIYTVRVFKYYFYLYNNSAGEVKNLFKYHLLSEISSWAFALLLLKNNSSNILKVIISIESQLCSLIFIIVVIIFLLKRLKNDSVYRKHVEEVIAKNEITNDA